MNVHCGDDIARNHLKRTGKIKKAYSDPRLTSESSELRGVQLILYHIPNEPSFAGMKTHPIVQNYTVKLDY